MLGSTALRTSGLVKCAVQRVQGFWVLAGTTNFTHSHSHDLHLDKLMVTTEGLFRKAARVTAVRRPNQCFIFIFVEDSRENDQPREDDQPRDRLGGARQQCSDRHWVFHQQCRAAASSGGSRAGHVRGCGLPGHEQPALWRLPRGVLLQPRPPATALQNPQDRLCALARAAAVGHGGRPGRPRAGRQAAPARIQARGPPPRL